MPSLSTIRATNAAFNHLNSPAPVAIFIGGTAGIGEAMARAFTAHTKGSSNIVIVARNQDAAEKILSSLPTPETANSSPHALSREFIQCDATLMKNVRTTAQTIISKYPKINYLVLSPGYLTLAGRDETVEGIDKKLALLYYARWSFIRDLMPALQRGKDANEEGAVMSVLGPGMGGPIDVNDLGLKETFSLKNAALATPTYNDLMLEVCLMILTLIKSKFKCFLLDVRYSTSRHSFHPRLSRFCSNIPSIQFSIGTCPLF
jgi:hypothetical protein